MVRNFRIHSVVVGALFIITMALGMVDAYAVMPLAQSGSELQAGSPLLLVGVFSVFFMAIGVVGIATAFYPVVRRQHEAIALTYVSFRVVECLLLLFGALLYLLVFFSGSGNRGGAGEGLPTLLLISKLKVGAFQLAMVTLGIGSLLLCSALYRSRVIPRWLSVWGMVGYLPLLLSALLDLLGVASTTSPVGLLLYIPGGLWELFVLPLYLFLKGFSVE